MKKTTTGNGENAARSSRSAFVFATTLAVASVATVGLARAATAGNDAGDAEPVLSLSSEHIGMSVDELDALVASDAGATAETTSIAAAHAEPSSADGAPAAPSAGAPDVSSPPPASPAVAADGSCPPAASGPFARTFNECVESSIRGGNGYDVSTAVCGAVFPSTPRW